MPAAVCPGLVHLLELHYLKAVDPGSVSSHKHFSLYVRNSQIAQLFLQKIVNFKIQQAFLFFTLIMSIPLRQTAQPLEIENCLCYTQYISYKTILCQLKFMDVTFDSALCTKKAASCLASGNFRVSYLHAIPYKISKSFVVATAYLYMKISN